MPNDVLHVLDLLMTADGSARCDLDVTRGNALYGMRALSRIAFVPQRLARSESIRRLSIGFVPGLLNQWPGQSQRQMVARRGFALTSQSELPERT